MQTKNVIYSEQPGRVMIYTNGSRARVEFPVNVTKIEDEDRTEWLAKKVYSFETTYTETLAKRIEDNYDEWLDKAKQSEVQPTTLADVVDALNALQEIILGGDI